MQTTHQALDKKEAFLSKKKKKNPKHAATDEIIGKTSSFTIGASETMNRKRYHANYKTLTCEIEMEMKRA